MPTSSELPYDFEDRALLDLALTHASTGAEEDNERLEFLGDAVLDLIVAEELFNDHPDIAEGDLTEYKASVVARRPLAAAALDLGLESAAIVGPGLANRTLPKSVLANLYEAVLGAVYMDGGLIAARSFVKASLKVQLRQVKARQAGSNPKQTLQQHCQKTYGVPPFYAELECRGQAHARAFLVRAEAGEDQFPSAWGRTRKEAERWAAHEALLVLRNRARCERRGPRC